MDHFDGDYSAAKFNAAVPAVLTQLLAMETGIYQPTANTPYYCTNLADCDAKFATGEIAMTM